MSERSHYLQAAIRLYLDLPGAPRRASRNDWAVAATFYACGVPLDTLAHVLRLATLRRTLRCPGDPPLEPVGSLAYYRRVLDHLTPEALDPAYIAYIAQKYRQTFALPHPSAHSHPHTHTAAVSHRQIPAISDRR